MIYRSLPAIGMWDQSLLRTDVQVRWWASVGFWWLILALTFIGLYIWFWSSFAARVKMNVECEG